MRHAGVVQSMPPTWSAPEQAPAVSSSAARFATGRFDPSIPLGGQVPVAVEQPRRSDRRDMVVAGLLLVSAVLCALASLMSWRDYGPGLAPPNSGWRMADGSFGRGWVAIVVAVVLAAAGGMLVAGQRRKGRVLARVGAIALILLAVGEWAFGDIGIRTGPGLGLWVLLVMGTVLVVAVGTVLPDDDPAPGVPSAA